MVESYSIVWTCHIYLTHLAVDEHLSCFHFLAVVMSIDMNIHIQTLECCIQFLCIYTWECSLQWALVSSLIFPVDCELREGRGRQTPTPGAEPANAWGADGTRLQHPESMSHSSSPTCPLSAPSCGPGSTDSSTHFFSLFHSLLHSDMCSDAHSSFPD